MPDVSDVLKNATAADLRVDHLGRIVITNPDLAKQVADASQLAPDLEQLAGNGLCCGNTGCASPELVTLLDRLVSRGGQR